MLERIEELNNIVAQEDVMTVIPLYNKYNFCQTSLKILSEFCNKIYSNALLERCRERRWGVPESLSPNVTPHPNVTGPSLELGVKQPQQSFPT